MTLRTRLSLTIAGIALLLVLPAVYSVSQLRQLQSLAEGQRLSHGNAYIALGRLQSSLSELKRSGVEFSIAPAVIPQESELDSVLEEKSASMVDALRAARSSIEQLDDAGYRAAADRARGAINPIGVATRRVELLMADNRRDESTTQFDVVKALIDATDPVLEAIGAEIDRNSTADIARAGRISTRAATSSLAALVLCMVLAITLGAWTTRALTVPIVRLRNAMSVVADGDFNVPTNLAFERDDEIGSASRSFRAMTLKLADLDKLKAEFLSFATHELRTPLNVVSGYAELLRDGVYGEMAPSQLEALEAIRDQTGVIAQLANQLLDIGRLEAGGLRLEMREIPLQELLQRVERSFDPLARQKDISLVIECDGSVPERVTVDPNRICDQVLGNLLSNALKFTPEHGEVRVSASRDDGDLVIEVRDTGAGIPADKLPQIFQRYYQVGDEARRTGAGLGLSIALAVARAHGGSIEAESMEDQGTVFRVRLPIAASRPGAAITV